MLKVKIFRSTSYEVEPNFNEWVSNKYDVFNNISKIEITQILQSSGDHYVTISVFYKEI